MIITFLMLAFVTEEFFFLRTSGPASGLITAGPSRRECVELPKLSLIKGALPVGVGVKAYDNLTGSSVSCLTVYLNGALNWAQWVTPYITSPHESANAWIAAAPHIRQLVLQVNLIPERLRNVNNPLGWEQACAAEKYDNYARTLATNLVSSDLQNSVIRLGAEMNGPWEADYVGTTITEQRLWAKCFANEVTSMRQASGQHFLFDWNPNSCYRDIPFKNYYPGNSFVDILGLDFYDTSCVSPSTPVTWNQLSNVPMGLKAFEAFAKEMRKPMSFPEWGLMKAPKGDDPSYVEGVGSTFASGDFAFESYFDSGSAGTLKIGSASPLSLKAFRRWFGAG